MKEIKGHRSWNYDEVVMMLRRTGGFTCCVLPHYRYDGVKNICRRLRRKGWIVQSGSGGDSVAVNYRMTEAMRLHFWKDGKDLV